MTVDEDALLAKILNDSSAFTKEEFECLLAEEGDRHRTDAPLSQCHRSWDRLLCWPPTPPASLARLPCFSELNGIHYDTTKNATRWCGSTGVWDNYSDYTACSNLVDGGEEFGESGGVEVSTILYFTGYTMSLVALGLAVWIFVYFKSLSVLAEEDRHRTDAPLLLCHRSRAELIMY